MRLETCRYKVEDGKIITKMFGMGDKDWDIEPGWHHDPRAAKAAVECKEEKPKKIDGRSKAAKQLKAKQDDDSTGFNQLGS